MLFYLGLRWPYHQIFADIIHNSYAAKRCLLIAVVQILVYKVGKMLNR